MRIVVSCSTRIQVDGNKPVACPFAPGDVVSGIVSAKQKDMGVVAVDLVRAFGDNGEDELPTCEAVTTRGILPYAHLGDHASLCDKTLADKLSAGTKIERLLVIEINRRGVPLVSMKPLLLMCGASNAAKSDDVDMGGAMSREHVEGAFVPRGISDVASGEVVAGFVSRVEPFGVFVRFLGGFSALCPRSAVSDRAVEDPTGMFVEGDSVRCDLRASYMVQTVASTRPPVQCWTRNMY